MASGPPGLGATLPGSLRLAAGSARGREGRLVGERYGTHVTDRPQRGLEFQILGPFRVVAADGDAATAMSIGPMKERVLLAVLVLSPNRTVSLDALIDALWGEHPPPSARKLVQIYVSHLRKILGNGVVGTRQSGYALQTDADAIDVWRFERLVLDGCRASQQGDAALAAALFDEGLGLWRGPVLAEFAFEQFSLVAAGRMEELRRSAFEERADAYLALGRHGELVGQLQVLVGEHPLRERLRAQLMLALYRSDRQVDALRIYDDGRRVLLEELGVEPRRPLQALRLAILEQDPALDAPPDLDPPVAARTDMPVASTPLVGRDLECTEMLALMRSPGTRLVSVTGPGGIGKTRLAMAVSATLADEFDAGPLFVDLAALRDPALVIVEIAKAVESVQPLTRRPGQTVADCVASSLGSKRLLLVVDNFEQVASAATELASLIAAAPGLTLIVTSRVRLRITGERVYPVPPLAVPAPRDLDDLEDAGIVALVGRFAGLELFVERARAVVHDFELTPSIVTAAARICTRLEGVALAIELAAARVVLLNPTELLERLDPCLPLLADGAWDLPARQRTLRATIDWSYTLLQPSQQELLDGLACFSGGWTLAAAEYVCGPGDILRDLTSLLDSSLVRRIGNTPAPRYAMLETVREYGLEQLAERRDAAGYRERVAAYFVALAHDAEPQLSGADQAVWFRRLEAEHDNLRATLRWLHDSGQPIRELETAASLGRYWYVRGHLDEGRRALEGALERAASVAPPEARAKAFRAASAVAVIQGDYGGARALAERGLGLYRATHDAAGVVRSLSNLGAILLGAGDIDRAILALDESVELSRGLADRRVAAMALNNRGDVALTTGDYPKAVTMFEESLALLRSAGDVANVARSLFNLGAATLESGSALAARRLLHESLSLSVEVGDKEDVIWCLLAISAVAVRHGDAVQAAKLLAGATALLDELGATMKPFEQGLHERTLATIRSRVDADRLATAWAAGRRLAYADLIAAARSVESSTDEGSG